MIHMHSDDRSTHITIQTSRNGMPSTRGSTRFAIHGAPMMPTTGASASR